MDLKITFDLLPVLGVVFSIAAWYIPKFKDWYEKLDPPKKQLVMLGLLFGIDIVVVGLSLAGFLNVYQGPTWREWVWYPLVDFVAAMIANAGTYGSTNRLLGNKKAGG